MYIYIYIYIYMCLYIYIYLYIYICFLVCDSHPRLKGESPQLQAEPPWLPDELSLHNSIVSLKGSYIATYRGSLHRVESEPYSSRNERPWRQCESLRPQDETLRFRCEPPWLHGEPAWLWGEVLQDEG